tara:strand:- start:67 stop:471 length:405 start_codon:yes stop_codon:yes gene_type:complete
MSLRYKSRINLGIISIDLHDIQSSYQIVVSDDGGVPSYIMYGPHQPLDVLKKICKKHLEIDPEWLDIRLLDVTNHKTNKGQELNLNYGVLIPNDIDIINGRWVGISDYFSGSKKDPKLLQNYNDIIQKMSLIIH